MPTRTSLENADQKTAYGYLISNLMAPGVGTLMMGQKTVGWCQILLAFIGTFFSVYGVGAWAVTLLRTKDPSFLFGTNLFIGLGGIVVFLISWGWGFWTAYQLIQKSNK